MALNYVKHPTSNSSRASDDRQPHSFKKAWGFAGTKKHLTNTK